MNGDQSREGVMGRGCAAGVIFTLFVTVMLINFPWAEVPGSALLVTPFGVGVVLVGLGWNRDRKIRRNAARLESTPISGAQPQTQHIRVGDAHSPVLAVGVGVIAAGVVLLAVTIYLGSYIFT